MVMLFFFNDTATTEIYTLSLHDALPIFFYTQLAGLSAVPILVDTKDVDEFVETVVRIAPGFGAIHLEDISAPECFEIERRLIERLPQPVMHDDAHGTAGDTPSSAAAGSRHGGKGQDG